MDSQTLAYWLTRFALEVRKVDGSEYPLYHSIIRHMRSVVQDLKSTLEFSTVQSSLDVEIKCLQSKGLGSTHKPAEPVTPEEEEQSKILGDRTRVIAHHQDMHEWLPYEVVKSTGT